MGFRHAEGEMVESQTRVQCDFLFGFGRIVYAVCAVDFAANQFDFFLDGHIQRIEEAEITFERCRANHRFGECYRARAAFRPMPADDCIHSAGFYGCAAHEFQFGGGIAGERVDRDDDVHAEFLCRADVMFQIRHPRAEQVEIFLRVGSIQRFPGDDFRPAAVHLERANGRHHNHHFWNQPGVSAFDVEEFFHPDIRAEAGFGDDEAVLADEFERNFICQNRRIPVCDIGKRSRMNENGRSFQRLHQRGFDGIFHQHGERACHA